MASKAVNLSVRILADAKNAAKGLADTEAGVGKLTSAAAKVTKAVGSTMVTGVKVAGGAVLALGGIVAGLAAKGGIARALAIQEAQAQLKGLGHDADTVATIMTNATAAVKGTAFGLGDAATIAASAVAAGIKPGQDLERSLKLVADAAAIAKTDMGSMGAIFNKVAASNKVQMDVINQLHDAGVPALQLLASEMGVTAAEASKMASKGKIDFATFQRAMESGLGGAAQSTGDTFRGSAANIVAALGRIGAKFATPVITGAPTVFKSLIGAVDSLGEVLQPVADRFSARLVPAMERAATWIARLDFAQLASTLSSRFSPAIDKARELLDRFDLGRLLDAARSGAGYLSGLLGILNPLGAILHGAAPSLSSVSGALGAIGAAVGGVLVAVLPSVVEAFVALADVAGGALTQILPTVTDLLGQVADLVPTITPVVLALVPAITSVVSWLIRLVTPVLSSERALKTLVAAFALWKAVGVAKVVAGQVTALVKSAATWWKETTATLANTKAKIASKAETLALAAMYAGQWIKQQALSIAGWVREKAAMVAHKAASLASAAATKAVAVATNIAAVAQRAMNVALRANPIGIVITLVAALVAGLVWFFTKTETGKRVVQAAWAAIKAAIDAVVTFWTGTVVPAFRAGVDAVAGFFTTAKTKISDTWDKLVAWVKNIPARIASAVAGVTAQVRAKFDDARSAAQTVFDTAVTWFRNIPGRIASSVAGVGSQVRAKFDGARTAAQDRFNSLVDWARNIPARIASAIAGVGSQAKAKFDGVRTGAVEKFNQLVDWVRGIPGRIVGALGSTGSLLTGAGRNILDGLLRGIREGFEKVKDFVGSIGSWIARNKGPKAYDLKLLRPAGGWIMTGLNDSMRAQLPTVAKTARLVGDTIATAMAPSGTSTRLAAITGRSAATPGATGGIGSAFDAVAMAAALDGVVLTLEVDGQPVRGIVRAELGAQVARRRLALRGA